MVHVHGACVRSQVIEIFSSGFYAGELGPSTIVGSAAFNLMVGPRGCTPPVHEHHVHPLTCIL